MVAVGARDDDALVTALALEKLDAALDALHQPQHGLGGRQLVGLLQLLVDVAGHEVAKHGEHERVDAGAVALDLRKAHDALEKLGDATVGNGEVEIV